MHVDDGMQEQLDEETESPGIEPADDALAEVEPVLSDDEPDEDEATSLEDLVARRAASLGRGEEVEDDPEELIGLAPHPSVRSADPLPTKVVPIKARREFVCNRCHLVKARSQLADQERGLCRDCV